MGRAFRSASNSAMRALRAASEKKVSWRRRARIQRSTTCTATSTLALRLQEDSAPAGCPGADRRAGAQREVSATWDSPIVQLWWQNLDRHQNYIAATHSL